MLDLNGTITTRVLTSTGAEQALTATDTLTDICNGLAQIIISTRPVQTVTITELVLSHTLDDSVPTTVTGVTPVQG